MSFGCVMHPWRWHLCRPRFLLLFTRQNPPDRRAGTAQNDEDSRASQAKLTQALCDLEAERERAKEKDALWQKVGLNALSPTLSKSVCVCVCVVCVCVCVCICVYNVK